MLTAQVCELGRAALFIRVWKGGGASAWKREGRMSVGSASKKKANCVQQWRPTGCCCMVEGEERGRGESSSEGGRLSSVLACLGC